MPSDSSNRGRSRHSAGLLLRVERPAGHADEFYLASGMTIGRTQANTVVLADDASVDRTHARVEIAADGGARLRCVEPDGSLTVDGELARELFLDEGVRFRIGRTEFECVSGRRAVEGPSTLTSLSCPFCGSGAVPIGGEETRPCPECDNPVLPVLLDPDDPAPLLVPAVFGAYLAERYVARGGMGLVLKGAGKDGLPVAIKVLFARSPSDRRDADRFEREVAMLSRVRHPNVVGLFDHGKAGRFDYLALEWVDGPSLSRLIAYANGRGIPTDFAMAFRWFTQVCQGLGAIHAAGMVHRDIKPSNILLGLDGVARIADLGIARRVDAGHTACTMTGHHALGTQEYMAPEQIHAPEAVDGRADQFALGVAFYELLTGTRPVGAWRPASKVNPTVPQSFDAILAQLLASEREGRFGDINAILAIPSQSKSRSPTVTAHVPVNEKIELPAISPVARRQDHPRGASVLLLYLDGFLPGARAVAARIYDSIQVWKNSWNKPGSRGLAKPSARKGARHGYSHSQRAGLDRGIQTVSIRDETVARPILNSDTPTQVFLGKMKIPAVWGGSIFGLIGLVGAANLPLHQSLILVLFMGGRGAILWVWLWIFLTITEDLGNTSRLFVPVPGLKAWFFGSTAAGAAVGWFLVSMAWTLEKPRLTVSLPASVAGCATVIRRAFLWLRTSDPSILVEGAESLAYNEGRMALALLDEAIRLDPRHACALVARATLFASPHQYDIRDAFLDPKTFSEEAAEALALADLDEAIRLEPSCASAYLLRARIGPDWTRRLVDLDYAVLCNPTDAVARLRRAQAREVLGEPGAMEDFDESIRLAPESYECRIGRAAAFMKQGEPARAVADLDEAIRFAPRPASSWLYRLRAEAYHALGNVVQSENDLALSEKLLKRPFW